MENSQAPLRHAVELMFWFSRKKCPCSRSRPAARSSRRTRGSDALLAFVSAASPVEPLRSGAADRRSGRQRLGAPPHRKDRRAGSAAGRVTARARRSRRTGLPAWRGGHARRQRDPVDRERVRRHGAGTHDTSSRGGRNFRTDDRTRGRPSSAAPPATRYRDRCWPRRRA